MSTNSTAIAAGFLTGQWELKGQGPTVTSVSADNSADSGPKSEAGPKQ